MNKIVKISDAILQNYFILISISALFFLYSGKGWIESVIFPLLIYIVAFTIPKKKGDFDVLIWILFAISIMTWLINDYDHKLLMIFRCILGQSSFMFAYFIGKSVNRRIYFEILEKAILPLVVCCVIGLFFFFNPPSWYIERVVESAGGATSGSAFWEFFRLKSIFNSPYYMSYFCAIEGAFIFYKILFLKSKLYFWLYLFLIMFALFLTMMRGPIICALMGIFFMYLYKLYLNHNFILIIKFVLLVGIGISSLIFLLNRMDSDQLDFLSEKIVTITEDSDKLKERTDLSEKYSFIGDGVGRHASYAQELSENDVLADSEYKKIMGEYGYSGLFVFIFLFVLVFVKCCRFFRYMIYESYCMVMLVLCMWGADPLSTGNKHCILFWMIIGSISSYKYSGYSSKILIK